MSSFNSLIILTQKLSTYVKVQFTINLESKDLAKLFFAESLTLQA